MLTCSAFEILDTTLNKVLRRFLLCRWDDDGPGVQVEMFDSKTHGSAGLREADLREMSDQGDAAEMYELLAKALKEGQQNAEVCRYALQKSDGGWEMKLSFQEADGIESVFRFQVERTSPEHLHERKNSCIQMLIDLHEMSSRDSRETQKRNELLQNECEELQKLIETSIVRKNEEESKLYEAFRRGLNSQKNKYAQLHEEWTQLRSENAQLKKAVKDSASAPKKRKSQAPRSKLTHEKQKEAPKTPAKKRRFTDNEEERESRRRRLEAIEAQRGKQEEEDEDEDVVQATQVEQHEGSDEGDGLDFGSESASFRHLE